MKKRIQGRKEGCIDNEQNGDRCWWWLASLFMVLILIATACGEEQPHTEGEQEGLPATIRLEVMPDEAAQAQTRADENAIKDLHVLVYNSKGELIGKNYGTSATLTVKARSGSGCTVYAIANTGNATLFDGTVTTEAKLKAMKTATLTAWDGLATASHLVMVGSKTGITIQPGSPTGNKIGNLTVTRIAAKVTLNIGVKAGSGITITDYEVCSLPKQSYYVFNNDADGATAWIDGTKVTVGAVSVSKTFLMYENRKGIVSSITAQKDKGGSKVPRNATYVVINGEANGYTATWQVYLGENNTSDFNMKRNSSYTYKITLSRPGTDGADTRVEVEVLPSNCYMVAPGADVNIPVVRANESYIQIGTSRMLDGKCIQLESNTVWTASLVWESSKGLITLSETTGTGPLGHFKVTATNNSTQGNAVVAIKNTSNDILWSWHIWIMTYSGNIVFTTNNGKRDFVFMDRALGATSAIPGELNSCGLLYQWGRKDPFPGPAQSDAGWNINNGTDATRVYNNMGSAYEVNKKSVPRVSPNNLTNAIRNPDTYYYYAGIPYDWFVYDSSSAQQNDLWSGGTNAQSIATKKSVFDPCPAGWRIPPFLDGFSPFKGMSSGYSWGDYGMSWSGTGGYFSASGYRYDQSGLIYNVRNIGNYWIGTGDNTLSYTFNISSGGVINDKLNIRAYGYLVRCCKDNL